MVTSSDATLGGAMTDQSSTTTSAADNSVYLGDGTATTAMNTISTNIAALSSSDLGLTDDLTTTAGAQAALTQITAHRRQLPSSAE